MFRQPTQQLQNKTAAEVATQHKQEATPTQLSPQVCKLVLQLLFRPLHPPIPSPIPIPSDILFFHSAARIGRKALQLTTRYPLPFLHGALSYVVVTFCIYHSC